MKVINKVIYTFLVLIFVFFFASCKPSNEETLKETFEQKPITGIDPIFEESLGYINQYPSAFRLTENLQYVYYSRNTEKYNLEKTSIAVRKAVKKDGKWEYKERKTVLLPSVDSWDKFVFSPDVIKGEFYYNNELYNYLMAYAGSEHSNQLNAQIGLAVAKNPTDEFIKVGTEPLITYDKKSKSTSGIIDYKGVQEPSLVSYDRKGKVQLFYSEYAGFNASMCLELDLSNLNDIKRSGRILSRIDGLTDGTNNTHLYSADWTFDPINKEYIVVRNFSSNVVGLPNIAEAVQVVYAPVSILTEVNHTRPEWEENKVSWNLINELYYKIGTIKTSDELSDNPDKWMGYGRVFTGTIISNPYGWILSNEVVELIVTSSALDSSPHLTGEQYLFSQMLHYYEVPIVKHGDS
jgi:hypothetical protein